MVIGSLYIIRKSKGTAVFGRIIKEDFNQLHDCYCTFRYTEEVPLRIQKFILYAPNHHFLHFYTKNHTHIINKETVKEYWNIEPELIDECNVKMIDNALSIPPAKTHWNNQNQRRQSGDGKTNSTISYSFQHPIRLLSLFLSQQLLNGDREFLSIVDSLKKFQYLLMGKRVTIYTDHQNLLYVINKTSEQLLSNRQINYIKYLEEFNSKLIHISGNKNGVADFLSRKYDSFQWDASFLEKIKEEQEAKFAPTPVSHFNTLTRTKIPLSSIKKIIRDNILDAQITSQKYYNKNRCKAPDYKVGDQLVQVFEDDD
ncbi:hypothetical protein RB653_003164 [Dictyostelium firmibasis]|uniref:Reverse transcriptase RNase H-like domain-containing protein n=1 Tax=Dictyostelium firmibasis TaxID=79012 RepID=A0AAN7YTE6_9MYCE